MADLSENLENAKNKASEMAETAKDKVSQTVQAAKDKLPDSIKDLKNQISDIAPTPPGLKAQSSVQDLKARLEWGEPALTIIDVRDRNTFNDGHIMGAMPMPMDELVERAKSSLESDRDIYVYGNGDSETATAANQLRQAGFEHVAELTGGFAAWKAIGGATEGIIESRTPAGADDYNVVSRIKSETHK